MPVNIAALKTFAPAMRRQLLEAVGRKLDLLLHSQTPWGCPGLVDTDQGSAVVSVRAQVYSCS